MDTPVDITVRILESRWRKDLPAPMAVARSAARAALSVELPDRLRRASRRRPVELNLVLANDRTVRRLNRDFRRRDKATNVLSFGGPEGWQSGAAGAPIMLGDVVLARETVAAEAAVQGKSMADHTRHLIVHGILHLLGHDHARRPAARRMEAIEIDVLATLGVRNPYQLAPARVAARRPPRRRS